MSEVIDLDAARAARRETKGKGPVIRWQGVEYELPSELPFATLEALRLMATGDEKQAPAAVVDLAKALLEDSYAEFLAGKPSVDDVNVLMEGVIAAYGVADPLGSSAS